MKSSGSGVTLCENLPHTRMNVYTRRLKLAPEAVEWLIIAWAMISSSSNFLDQLREAGQIGRMAHGDTCSGEYHQIPTGEALDQFLGEIDFGDPHRISGLLCAFRMTSGRLDEPFIHSLHAQSPDCTKLIRQSVS